TALTDPLWSPDGRELFFGQRVGGLSSVSIATQPSFTSGNPAPVTREGFLPIGFHLLPRSYDVTPDGKRFVSSLRRSQTDTAAPQIHIVINWFEELKARVPTK